MAGNRLIWKVTTLRYLQAPVLWPQSDETLCVCFTSPCINLLLPPSATREYHPKARAVASRGPVVPGPSFEICAPHFTFGPLVAAYIQCCILKMWTPLWFLAPPAGKSWRRACPKHLNFSTSSSVLPLTCSAHCLGFQERHNTSAG